MSNVVILERGEWDEKGKWRGLQSAEIGRTAVVCCPNCGTMFSLVGHVILEDGVVTAYGQSPSVVCPAKCGFDENVQLLGWNP